MEAMLPIETEAAFDWDFARLAFGLVGGSIDDAAASVGEFGDFRQPSAAFGQARARGHFHVIGRVAEEFVEDFDDLGLELALWLAFFGAEVDREPVVAAIRQGADERIGAATGDGAQERGDCESNVPFHSNRSLSLERETVVSRALGMGELTTQKR
jgi:hypothetical protein